MSVTLTYNRPKVAIVNSTGIDLTILVGEQPDAPTAIGGTGTTGIVDGRHQADADESIGVDVQDLWKWTLTPSLTTDGKIKLTVVVTPVGGAGADLTSQTLVVDHPETMDAWQAAAGRARQA